VIIGCDYSGVVVKLGEDLLNPDWKVGDQIAGMVHGGKFTDKGAFAGTFCLFFFRSAAPADMEQSTFVCRVI
jgi:NADPH:quinone reductase-like Zn-dependent oxidoreductase